ncbi:MAG: histidinol dehydrogenase [Chloroflexi bacterium]|nr:histidinol dehydrogenase [Chloroflexota bacterium]
MKIVHGLAQARAAVRRPAPDSSALPPAAQARIKAIFGKPLTVEEAVARIIEDVRAKGDAALLDYTRRIDGVSLKSLTVSKAEIAKAAAKMDKELLAALERAADRIREFHQVALPVSWFDEAAGLGQQIEPIASVAMYVPGGTAAYPSTVLHTAVPARVAGVKSVVIATPPGKDGAVTPVILAAAKIAGVDTIYKMGGAQAVAALALGTKSVAKVDKIVGPGNVFVTAAKRRLFGAVGIDGLHGPTETLIVADDSANARLVAADLLAQAEHDVLATPVLITPSAKLAQAVAKEVASQLATLERKAIAAESVKNRGLIALVKDVREAVTLANEVAPEHLCLVVRNAREEARHVRNAGGIFLGEGSPEVLGDYNAGPSHVMPTMGTARFSSALGLHDFVRVTSVIGLRPGQAKGLAGDAARIARAEGLTAHARSAELRM